MKPLGLLCTLVCAYTASTAAAEENSLLAEACLAAVHFAEQSDDAIIDDEQSFPELDPPRVQIRIAYDDIALTQRIRCVYASNERPLGLAQICVNDNCDFPTERLQELQILLTREGY